jgi:hypothetical protein
MTNATLANYWNTNCLAVYNEQFNT